MLLCVTHLLSPPSKCKKCNRQDANPDVQQYNIHTTSKQEGIIILLKFHYVPTDSYCSGLH